MLLPFSCRVSLAMERGRKSWFLRVGDSVFCLIMTLITFCKQFHPLCYLFTHLAPIICVTVSVSVHYRLFFFFFLKYLTMSMGTLEKLLGWTPESPVHQHGRVVLHASHYYDSAILIWSVPEGCFELCLTCVFI